MRALGRARGREGGGVTNERERRKIGMKKRSGRGSGRGQRYDMEKAKERKGGGGEKRVAPPRLGPDPGSVDISVRLMRRHDDAPSPPGSEA